MHRVLHQVGTRGSLRQVNRRIQQCLTAAMSDVAAVVKTVSCAQPPFKASNKPSGATARGKYRIIGD